MKRLITILFVAMFLAGCGSVIDESIKTSDDIAKKVKINKSKFDKNESYTALSWCIACYGQEWLNSTYHLRGWKQGDGSIKHQLYIISSYEAADYRNYKTVSMVGGDSTTLTEINIDRRCENQFMSCRKIEDVGMSITTDMLQKYRKTGLELRLDSGVVGGDLEFKVEGRYIDGYLKALDL